MPFKPTDFTQVNPHINRVLVAHALRLLNVQKTDRVIDWFCGLGNFTLPLATQAREVLGIEGSDTVVARSLENYKKNKASSLASIQLCAINFVAINLFEMTGQMLVDDGYANRWLIDPPREGAFALVKALAQIHQQHLGNVPEVVEGEELLAAVNIGPMGHQWQPPERIVYVSCNPSTLAREQGFWCIKLATAAQRLAWLTCSRIPRTSRAWRCLNGNRAMIALYQIPINSMLSGGALGFSRRDAYLTIPISNPVKHR